MSIINSNSTSSDNSNEKPTINPNSTPLAVNKGSVKNSFINPCSFITTEGRFGRVNFVDKPEPGLYGNEPTYLSTFLFPKEDTKMIEKYDAAVEATIVKGIEKLKGATGEIPTANQLKFPLKDGDEHKDPAYKNHYYFNCTCRDVPGICDIKLQEIDPKELYSGVYVRLSISLYTYNHGVGNSGIGIWLKNVQKTRDGTPFSRCIFPAGIDFADGFTLN